MQALKHFKIYFFRGLAALLPTVLTIWLFVQFYVFLQTNVNSYINRGVVRIMVFSTPNYPYISTKDVAGYVKSQNPGLSETSNEFAEQLNSTAVKRQARIAKAEKFWVRGNGQIVGFLIAFIFVIFLGAFLASFIGKAIWKILERMLAKVPIIKKIYPSIKQVTDFFLVRKKLSFNRVVAVEYPRKGVWSIAMVTGKGLKKISQNSKKEYLTVFVPTSPTPFTGYVIIVPKEETIELSMTIEEALRFTVSGGVIEPATFESYSANKEITGTDE